MDETRMSKGWRRLVVIFCTLLLAGSVFLVLGVTVWAQEQPQPTEQPTGTEQPAQTTQQPAQTGQTTQQQGLVIDYWEPQVGTRTVYYTNDFMNDIHGNIYGTGWLGYGDAAFLYSTSIARINYSSSYYYNVDAVSDMNPVYFNLTGPWYFYMTTPFKYVEEVVGINQAPDAAAFPQATYAVRYILIGSGGHRMEGYLYRTNDATQKTWLEWGYTLEWFELGQSEHPKKEIVHYRSPSDHKTAVSETIITFPLSVGTTGSIDAHYSESSSTELGLSASAAYEVVAEGKITVPAGTFNALLVKANATSPPDEEQYTQMQYTWFAKDLGFVAEAASLWNEIDPTYETATYIQVLEYQTLPGAAQQ